MCSTDSCWRTRQDAGGALGELAAAGARRRRGVGGTRSATWSGEVGEWQRRARRAASGLAAAEPRRQSPARSGERCGGAAAATRRRGEQLRRRAGSVGFGDRDAVDDDVVERAVVTAGAHTFCICSSTSRPFTIWPNRLYCGGSPTPLAPETRKNWLPLVFGPALAMATEPIWYWPALGQLVLELVAGAAAAGAGGVAALAHEAVDDAVEDDAVVVVVEGEEHEVVDRLGCLDGVEGDHDLAERRVERRRVALVRGRCPSPAATRTAACVGADPSSGGNSAIGAGTLPSPPIWAAIPSIWAAIRLGFRRRIRPDRRDVPFAAR